MRWFGLGAGVISGALCAFSCGGSPTAEPPKAPEPAAPSAPVAAAPSATPPETPAPPAAAPVPADRQRPLVPSTLLGDLEKAGLKPGAFPRLEALSTRQRLPVMEAFSKALGVKCTGCHVSDKDLKAPTRNKELARNMWDKLVVPMRLGDQQLFCDTCHQGSAEILHRADRAAVSAFMKTELVAKIKTADGTSCATCHGTPFEGHVFEKLWNVKEKG